MANCEIVLRCFDRCITVTLLSVCIYLFCWYTHYRAKLRVICCRYMVTEYMAKQYLLCQFICTVLFVIIVIQIKFPWKQFCKNNNDIAAPGFSNIVEKFYTRWVTIGCVNLFAWYGCTTHGITIPIPYPQTTLSILVGSMDPCNSLW